MNYPNRNASPINFGFQYQINVAIYFLFKYLKDLKYIKVEGEDEDIELTLKDSSKFMIQAKSNATNLDNDGQNSTKLREALESLSEADKGKVTWLYYVSNFKNPLNSKTKEFEHNIVTLYTYNELDRASQDKIDKQVMNNLTKHQNDSIYQINKNKLWIMKIPFFGEDDEQRHFIIYERAKEELSYIGESLSNHHRSIVNQLEAEFLQNAASNSKTKITSEEICNLLIVDELQSIELGNIYEKIGISEGEFYEAKMQYEKYLDKKVNNYENYLKVRSLYEKSRDRDVLSYGDFVKKERISLYNYFFSEKIDTDDQINESNMLDICIAQIISYIILMKQSSIRKIRIGVGL